MFYIARLFFRKKCEDKASIPPLFAPFDLAQGRQEKGDCECEKNIKYNSHSGLPGIA